MHELTLDIPFKLFEDCIPVKGHSRSIICDLGRNSYFLIPNDLFTILTDFDGRKISHIINHYGKSNKATIIDYFSFLIKKEIIFFTETPKLFPKIDFSEWDYSSDIYQAIVDVENNISNFSKIIKELDEINCKFLEIRLFNSLNKVDLRELLKVLEGTTIIGIDIYIKYNVANDIRKLKSIMRINKRINNIFMYNSPINRLMMKSGVKSTGNFFMVKQNIENNKSCGVVSPTYFSINTPSFTKAKSCNTCLHGKISVDGNGNIKNCPSLQNNYGNISKITLKEVSMKPQFKKYWDITKDKIKICKDCEFRYICTDCRAYVNDPKDQYSQPLKCGYDPYTGLWNKWTNNPLKKKAMGYYKL